MTRQFVRSPSGSLFDINRLDGVMKNGSGNWAMVISGCPVEISESFAEWLKQKLSENAEFLDVPSEIVLTPEPRE